MHRHICLGLALTLLVACSDDPAGPGRDPDPDPDPQPTATPVLVSGPVAPAAAGADVRSVRGDGSRVFVSMPPGTEPGGTSVTVGMKTSTASVRAPVVDGGFDPVAVEALAGDSLIIVVTRPGGSEVSYAKVPAASKPVVVRTSPRHRRVDVPLNPVIVIVFNQPMTFGSLTPAIRLWRAGIEVAGTLTPVVTDGHVLGAQLVPDELLAAATTYTLEVTTAALDFDGTPLEAARPFSPRTAPA